MSDWPPNTKPRAGPRAPAAYRMDRWTLAVFCSEEWGEGEEGGTTELERERERKRE